MENATGTCDGSTCVMRLGHGKQGETPDIPDCFAMLGLACTCTHGMHGYFFAGGKCGLPTPWNRFLLAQLAYRKQPQCLQASLVFYLAALAGFCFLLGQ